MKKVSMCIIALTVFGCADPETGHPEQRDSTRSATAVNEGASGFNTASINELKKQKVDSWGGNDTVVIVGITTGTKTGFQIHNGQLSPNSQGGNLLEAKSYVWDTTLTYSGTNQYNSSMVPGAC